MGLRSSSSMDFRALIVPPVTRVVRSHVLLKNDWANLDQIQCVVTVGEGDKYLIFHDPLSQWK